MSSPPPTPSSEVPSDPSQDRFHPIAAPTEWVETYRPGHFHPIHIGDVFKDGRFTVIRKLGYGSFSTVWLAFDNQIRKPVALKVLAARESPATAELSILEHLARVAPTHPGSNHVITFLDSFRHTGPNGTHLCLVFEVLGTTTASMVLELPCNKPRRLGHRPRYAMWMVKRILRHTLLGLSFLHQNSIVHGDVQPGNLLFVPNLASIEVDKLQQDPSLDGVSTPVKRLDGKLDKWAPRYLLLDAPLTEFVDLGPGLTVKLSDMGAASWPSKPPKEPVTPVGLRAPELVLGLPFDQSIDIWSFGCLVFEFVTGMSLFTVSNWSGLTQDESNDDHLLQLTDVLGVLPENLFSKWTRSNRYFGPDRVRFNSIVGEIPEGGGSGDPPFRFDPLEKYFQEQKPKDVDDSEALAIIALLRRILQYEPEKRPSAADLIQDSWFDIENDCTALPAAAKGG